jgi:multidrug efflux pump
MVLSDLSIKRPVLATVMSLTIILIGWMAYSRLTVREYPNIDAPTVSVRTVYLGASSSIMESQVTQPLEDQLSGIEGIKAIKSQSKDEVSAITVEFVRERDADSAANDVRDRVARARALMPSGIKDPVVAKIEADAQAIIWLAFSSSKHDTLAITDYADRYVLDQLKVLPGVATVIIGGDRRFAMRIWLDRDRLAAFGLTPLDVENALRRQNIEVPGGRIESTQREFTVTTKTDLRTAEEFNNLIVNEAQGYPVRLKDIGRAELSAEDWRKIVRVGGNEAVGLGVVKQSTANTLDVAHAVRDLQPKIQAGLPDGMQVKVAFDSAIFIDEAIKAVKSTIFEALILVVLVIFLFLRSLRSTLIPFVTIPVSLIGAFIFLYALGFTINILTLLGIVLAIGLVVDDAIVVLENIYRHVEEGMSPYQAALKGSREIAFAVIAMTITLAAVFTPLAFIPGNTGKLFSEFALTVAAAVLVSGFVALTLTPMMCSKLLKHQAKHSAIYNFTERFFVAMNNGYRRVLGKLIRRSVGGRLVFIGIIYGVAVSGILLYGMMIKDELSPQEDRSWFMTYTLAPEGSSFAYTNQYALAIEKILKDVPEINTSFVVVAPGLEKPNPVNIAMSFNMVQPWSQRTKKTGQISGELFPKFMALPGVLTFPINPPSLGQSFRNLPVRYVIQAPTYEKLSEYNDKLIAKARDPKSGLMNPDSDLKLNKPQLKVWVDRDKAASMGVEVDEIGRTVETMLGGRQVTRFQRDGKQYDVIVQLEDAERAQPNDLTSIFVRTKDRQLVQLSNLVRVDEGVAASSLNHYNRLRSATIEANLAPGIAIGQALDYLDHAATEIMGEAKLTAYDGTSREFKESGTALWLTIGLACVFIYLVLAAQFESFLSPLVIMLTVPLAWAGALFFLYWSNGKLFVAIALLMGKTIPAPIVAAAGGTLNVYSKIGLVMLIGLITKHGILIVEFANQLREKGKDKAEAVIEAATLRLRPILMTTAAMVLGALPLVTASGAGAEARSPIGIVIVGGLLVGTLLTLFVIPVAYTLLTGKLRHVEEDEGSAIPHGIVPLPERAAGAARSRIEPMGAPADGHVSMRRED